MAFGTSTRWAMQGVLTGIALSLGIGPAAQANLPNAFWNAAPVVEGVVTRASITSTESAGLWQISTPNLNDDHCARVAARVERGNLFDRHSMKPPHESGMGIGSAGSNVTLAVTETLLAQNSPSLVPAPINREPEVAVPISRPEITAETAAAADASVAVPLPRAPLPPTPAVGPLAGVATGVEQLELDPPATRQVSPTPPEPHADARVVPGSFPAGPQPSIQPLLETDPEPTVQVIRVPSTSAPAPPKPTPLVQTVTEPSVRTNAIPGATDPASLPASVEERAEPQLKPQAALASDTIEQVASEPPSSTEVLDEQHMESGDAPVSTPSAPAPESSTPGPELAEVTQTDAETLESPDPGPTLANARWVGFAPVMYTGGDDRPGAWIAGPFDRQQQIGWITDTATGATARVKFYWRDAGDGNRTATLSREAARALGINQGDVANIAVYLPR